MAIEKTSDKPLAKPLVDAPFLSIRNLRKTYGHAVAIDGVSLDIRQGEFMTFLGPSGSGKSTTLYITAGFQDPTEGTVQLNGKSLLNVPPNQRNIGMVFQRYTLFPHLSVAENVAFPLRVRGWDKSKIADRVKAMLKLVHLDQHGDRKPSQLSGGQQQRVAIARALAYNPPVLLMDEPLSALDKQLREEIQFELKRIHHDTGITILYVTHDQEEALRLSDRIAVFNKGRIEQVGTGAELYEHPATRFVAGFIGHSNFLPVKLVQRRGDVADIVLPDGRRLEGAPLRCDAANGSDAALMLRPDRLHLLHEAGADTPSIPVRVTDLSYLGDVMQVHLATNWHQDLDIRLPLRPGATPDWQVGSLGHLAWVNAHSQVHAAA